jgi:hypothetical protein
MMNEINFDAQYLSEYFLDYSLMHFFYVPAQALIACSILKDQQFEIMPAFVCVIDNLYLLMSNNHHEAAAIITASGAHLAVLYPNFGLSIMTVGIAYELYNNL